MGTNNTDINSADWWKSGINNPSFQASSGPAYARVSSIPSWLPAANTSELSQTYGSIPQSFDTTAYDRESGRQQSRILSSALSSGNAAADEYANRARQSGGSMLGAGLVRAEAQTNARKTAGEFALKQQEFDAKQRESAATQSALIARNLGDLRQNYLSSLVTYATQEDSISQKNVSDAAGNQASMWNASLAHPGTGWTATLNPTGGGATAYNSGAGIMTPIRVPGQPGSSPLPPSTYFGGRG